MRSSYRAQAFPKHTHDFFTIGLVLRGAGTLWYRGAEHLARCGEVVVIPPGEVHTGSVAPGAGVLEYLAAHVPAEVIPDCVDDGGARDADLEAPVILDDAVAAHLRRLEHAAMQPTSSARHAADEASHGRRSASSSIATGARRARRPRRGASAPGWTSRAWCTSRAKLFDDCYGDNAQTSPQALALRTGVSRPSILCACSRASSDFPRISTSCKREFSRATRAPRPGTPVLVRRGDDRLRRSEPPHDAIQALSRHHPRVVPRCRRAD